MRVAFVTPDDFTAWQFHRGLRQALVERGDELYIVCPSGEYVPKLEQLGARHVHVDLYRFVSPTRDVRAFVQLRRIFRRLAPDVVHTFMMKPNIYGGPAARSAGVPRVVGTVEGLGFTHSADAGLKMRLLRPVVRTLSRMACRSSDRYWFVNPDDVASFVSDRLIPPEKVFQTLGAGVDTETFHPHVVDRSEVLDFRRGLGISDDAVVLLMVVARVVWTKGVKEFVEASRRFTGNPRVEFLLVGPIEEESPDAVPESYLRAAEGSNFRWLGFEREIRRCYAAADIVTLPSFYPEGLPNVLIEAMAMGKPVITTDSVGCKEVVEDGRSGLLIATRSTTGLVDAVSLLARDGELRGAMAVEARKRAVGVFDERSVTERVLRELYGSDLAI